MDIDPQPLAPLPQSRKRAASSPSPAPDAVPGAEYGSSEHDAGHAAVRARVTSELDTLGVIPRDEAWQLHLAQVLEVEDGRAGDGLTLLCVGERKEALELLR